MREIPKIVREPLSPERLRETVDLTLWAAQLLMQGGAEAAVIERTVHRLGTGLGADWLDVFLSSNAVTITVSSGGEFRTRTRRVISQPINMSVLADIAALNRRIKKNHLGHDQVRAELDRISTKPRAYNRWLTLLMVGLACAAFSQLFEGDLAAFVITWAAASAGMFVRQTMARRYFNALLITITTAFVTGLVASALTLSGVSQTPRAALAASVLLLVPGVAFINGAEDLIKGYTVSGLTRGVQGALISLGIALGLLAAVSIMGGIGL